MLLRSGSHIKGKERKKYLRRSEGDALLSYSSSEINDMNNISRRRSARHLTTVVTTTTITTEEEMMQREAAAKKLLEMEEDSSESKLRLDESQTEKQVDKPEEFTLRHLHG